MARSRFWLVVLMSATVLAACTQEPSMPALGRVQRNAVAVQVDGFQWNLPEPYLGWVDTLLDVESGDHLSIRCTGGRIAPWGSVPIFDCNGDTMSPPWSESIAEQCAFGSLVGKIGTHGAPFCLGAEHDRPMTTSGRLYLGFNDGVSFQDNVGAWSVDVEIHGTTSDWTATTYQGCPAWRWNQDPDLLVALFDTTCLPSSEFIVGLYFVRGAYVHAYDGGSVRYAPIMSVQPPASGDPLISDISSLTLQVESLIDSHCESEPDHSHPVIEVSPRRLADDSIEITTTIQGMTYFGLPPNGTIHVAARQELAQQDEPACNGTFAPQTFTIDGASFAAAGTSKNWYCGLTSFTAEDTSLGDIEFRVLSPAEMSKLHFQSGPGPVPGQWIEFDVDHSCVAAPELRVITRVP